LLEEESIAIGKNLAAPSEKLFLSYSASSKNSEALYESIIVKNIKRAKKIEEKKGYSESSAEFVRNEKTARLFLASNSKSPAARSLRSIRFDAWSEQSEKPFGQTEKTIGDTLPEKFSGGGIVQLSVSSVENYSRCPYSFFLKNVVGLVPEKIRGFTGADMGNVYHQVLQDFFSSLSQKNYMLGGEPSRAEVREATERMLDSEIAKYREGLVIVSEYEKYKAERIKRSAAAGVFEYNIRTGPRARPPDPGSPPAP
jgi:ATP-dependent helicase/nuclease subunit B